MSVREYVGARYVPIIAGEWDNTRTYEPLMVVTYQGASYTSRQYVPAGIEITNESYWVLSANYNAQVEAYRKEVQAFDDRIVANTTSNSTQDAQLAGTTNSGLKTLITNEATARENKDTYLEQIAENRTKMGYVNPYFEHKFSLDCNNVQGGCVFDNKVAYAAIKDNTSATFVYVIDLSTKTITVTSSTLSLGHCNDMTYNPKEGLIVVAGTDKHDGNIWNIVKLTTSLVVDSTYTPAHNYFSIAYCPDDDSYFAMGGSAKAYILYHLDSDFNELASYTITTTQSEPVFQGIAYQDGYVWWCSTKGIYKISTKGKVIDFSPINVNTYYYEAEFIDFLSDGTPIIGGNLSFERIMACYKVSLENSVIDMPWYKTYNQAEHTWYVDFDTELTFQDYYNNYEGISVPSSSVYMNNITGILTIDVPENNTRIFCKGTCRIPSDSTLNLSYHHCKHLIELDRFDANSTYTINSSVVFNFSDSLLIRHAEIYGRLDFNYDNLVNLNDSIIHYNSGMCNFIRVGNAQIYNCSIATDSTSTYTVFFSQCNVTSLNNNTTGSNFNGVTDGYSHMPTNHKFFDGNTDSSKTSFSTPFINCYEMLAIRLDIPDYSSYVTVVLYTSDTGHGNFQGNTAYNDGTHFGFIRVHTNITNKNTLNFDVIQFNDSTGASHKAYVGSVFGIA